MSDQDRLKEILAGYQSALAAARSETESLQRELLEANPDLAGELKKHFGDSQTNDIAATVTCRE